MMNWFAMCFFFCLSFLAILSNFAQAQSCGIGVVNVTAGYFHNCATLNNSQIVCWAHNNNGALGLGRNTSVPNDRVGNEPNEMGANLPSVDLGTGRSVKQMDCGWFACCAILDNDSLKCWGNGGFGQLGLGNVLSRGDAPGEMGDSLPVVNLGTGRTAVQVSCGGFHTCAVLDNSTIKCWGSSDDGQLGYGDVVTRGNAANQMGDHLPIVSLGTGRTAKVVKAGLRHTCALLDNQRVKCWGWNVFGQLGLGDTNNRGNDTNQMGDFLPYVDLGAISIVLSIDAGNAHNCAILDGYIMKCWGANGRGQLGVGDIVNRGDVSNMGVLLPSVDLGDKKPIMVVCGNEFTCALLENSTVKCFGRNAAGELGYGDVQDRGDGPNEMGENLSIVDVGTGKTVKTLAVNLESTCAVLSDSTLRCWGQNDDGQLGIGNTTDIGDEPGEMGDSLTSIDFCRPTPTTSPSHSPSINPTTRIPTRNPSKNPSGNPTKIPSKNPSKNPSRNPTRAPSRNPSKNPSINPTKLPSNNPSKNPSKNPNIAPSTNPSKNPSRSPSSNPTNSSPSRNPSKNPSKNPSRNPSHLPSTNPSKTPTNHPSHNPTLATTSPTRNPSRNPTIRTNAPSNNPTIVNDGANVGGCRKWERTAEECSLLPGCRYMFPTNSDFKKMKKARKRKCMDLGDFGCRAVDDCVFKCGQLRKFDSWCKRILG